MYVTNIKRDAAAVGKAHGEAFMGLPHPPVATMVEVSSLVEPELLVEHLQD